MKIPLAALALFAAIPALAAPEPVVEPGAARFWKPADGRTAWTSDGVRIEIAPAPCDTPPQTEGCRFDKVNNQAALVVTAPGIAPVHVLSRDQASYYHVAVVRFGRDAARPGVVIANDSGGSGGDLWIQLLLPEGEGYREIGLPDRVQGALAGTLTDLSGDGMVDFLLSDGRFDSQFGCNACTPRPPLVFTIRNGQVVDISRDHAVAYLFEADMAERKKACGSRDIDRNGACAAYAADAAILGRFDAAWRFVAAHYEPHPQLGRTPFLPQLQGFLRETGYIR
ncbi:hypothetical protein AB2M62_17290 [Sphingomonas sp. MMS12-HWE2-04]|uniref:hypothetical protein n=1 Tax=Sphingomonas sp. MMS12-HWE2-04 TaxID=3234199 RepID=UPI00384E89CA